MNSLQPMQGVDAELLRKWDREQALKAQETVVEYPVNYPINWQYLYKAQEYYLDRGYALIEVPWLVDQQAIESTAPAGSHQFKTAEGSLIASGEQGLFAIRKRLKPGKYQTITPCFRKEVSGDPLLQQHLMKLELMYVPDGKENSVLPLANMLQEAKFCFEKLKSGLYMMQDTDQGVDIMHKGVEIGSYGVRKVDGFRWIYGTGLAEPRFSMALLGKYAPKGS